MAQTRTVPDAAGNAAEGVKAEAGDSTSRRDRHGSRSRLLSPGVAVVGAALAETAVAGYLVSRADFFADDFINFGQARAMGMSWNYLSMSVFGHFVPLYRLTNWIIVRAAPFNYSVIRVLQCACFFASIILIYRLLSLFSGARWSTALIAILAGASVLITPTLLWWANSLHIMPTIPLSVLTIDSFFRYQLTKRRRWIVIACAAYTIGLGFFDATMLVLVELILLEVLYRIPKPTPRKIAQHFAQQWGQWAGLLVPSALDLSWRISHWSEYYIPAKATADGIIHYLGVVWAFGLIPGALGASYPGVLTNGTAAVLMGQSVVALAVIASLLRRRSSWRAWLFFLLTMAVNLGVTAWARVGVFGPNLGLDYRYISYAPYVLAITITLAFLPVSVDATSRPLPIRYGTYRRGRGVRFCLGGLGAIALVGYLVGDGLSIQWWANNAGPWTSAAYFATFQKSYRRVEQYTQSPFLYDSTLPDNIQPSAFWPYNTYELTIGAMYPKVVIDRGRGTGFVLGPTGAVVPATFNVAASGSSVSATSGVAASIQDSATCYVSHSAQGSIAIPLTKALQAGAWFARIVYAAPRGEDITVLINDHSATYLGTIGDAPVRLAGGEGYKTKLLPLNTYAITGLSLQLAAGSKLCLRNISVGSPQVRA